MLTLSVLKFESLTPIFELFYLFIRVCLYDFCFICLVFFTQYTNFYRPSRIIRVDFEHNFE